MSLLGGIIAGAAQGIGQAGGEIADANTKLANQQTLNQQQADLAELKQESLLRFQDQIKAAPKNRAAGFLAAELNAQVPVSAKGPDAPIAPPDTPVSPELASALADTQPIPNQADFANYKVPPAVQAARDAGAVGIMQQEAPQITDPALASMLQRDIDRKQASSLAADPNAPAPLVSAPQPAQQVDGAPAMRKATYSEALQAAIMKAAQAKDGEALAELQGLQHADLMSNGYGGLTRVSTGEQLGTGAQQTRLQIEREHEAAKDQRAENANQTKLDVAKAKMAGQFRDPSTITQQEKDLWLHQYIAGNGAVPRSAPADVKNNIGTWAAQKGITPQDLSSGMAQTKFDQAAANTAGHRSGAMAGVEAVIPALASNALELAKKLDQGKFVPINKLMQMGEASISDPDLSAFRVAHQALQSEYQQVISRGGTGNVTALNEAMKVLNGATSPEAYQAAVGQVMREVAMNSKGMKDVRAGLGGAPEVVPNPLVAPVSTVPNDIADLMKKYGGK